MTVHGPARPTRSTGWVPVALVVLSLIPAVSGTLRLVEVFGGPHLMPENPRIAASPAPVVVHIVSVIPYAVLGAFQFSARLRRRRPGRHRATGRVLVALGLAVAFSGLWMTLFYPRQTGTGELAYVFRLSAGSAMAGSIILGLAAVRRGDIAQHLAWMTRAYALAGAHPGHRKRGLRQQRAHHRPEPRCGLGHQPRGSRVRHPSGRPSTPQHANQQAETEGGGRGAMTQLRQRGGPAEYRIRVAGHLDEHWSPWFGDLTLTHESDGATSIAGVVADQAQLHGLLAKVRDLGVTLLSVQVCEPAATVGQPAPTRHTSSRCGHQDEG